jgi:hypothetical protein
MQENVKTALEAIQDYLAFTYDKDGGQPQVIIDEDQVVAFINPQYFAYRPHHIFNYLALNLEKTAAAAAIDTIGEEGTEEAEEFIQEYLNAEAPVLYYYTLRPLEAGDFILKKFYAFNAEFTPELRSNMVFEKVISEDELGWITDYLDD